MKTYYEDQIITLKEKYKSDKQETKIQFYEKYLREKQKREEEEMAVLALKENLINFSLTCRCSGTAIPIGDTVNRYICLECGTRFVHAKHQFPSYYLSNELRNEIIILTNK